MKSNISIISFLAGCIAMLSGLFFNSPDAAYAGLIFWCLTAFIAIISKKKC